MRRNTRSIPWSRLFAIGAAIITLPFLHEPAGWALDLSVAGDTAHVSGATPGSSVVLFGATREVAVDDVVTTREYATVFAEADRAGTATFQLRTSKPKRAIFLAVDQATGEAAALRRGATGKSDQRWLGTLPAVGATHIRDGRRFALLLLVRPTKGFWVARVGDATSLDRDPMPNGAVDVDVADFTELSGTGKAPNALEAGDRLATLDPGAMELAFQEIKGDRQ